MDRVASGVLLLCGLAFAGGWKVAAWQHDSVELAIRRTAAATGNLMADASAQSGRRLEETLEALKNAPPREIRTEVVKPVFTSVCMSDDFVRMFNDAAAASERALSGKPDN